MTLEIIVFNLRDFIKGGHRDWLHKGYKLLIVKEIPMDILCGGSSPEKCDRGQMGATLRLY